MKGQPIYLLRGDSALGRDVTGHSIATVVSVSGLVSAFDQRASRAQSRVMRVPRCPLRPCVTSPSGVASHLGAN